jgi:putative FmdB family regulatory protein
MPIYEFYCTGCNTIFNFFSKRIDTEKCPKCPKCKKQKLDRQVSMFSAGSNAGDSEEADGMSFDEKKMEGALTQLASEAEGINENDPKAAANLMRKFSSMTGVEFGGSMDEALRRLEAGENPEEIEKELGDMMEGEEDPFVISQKGGKKTKRPPSRDETLYEM